MHINDLIAQALDIPFVDLDIPFEELVLEDLPSMDEALQDNPVTPLPSSPPTAGLTPYSERISIRINHGVLLEIKKRAAAAGERYQTYINQILAIHAGS